MGWEPGKGSFIRLFGLDIFNTTRASAANWLVKRAAANMKTDVAFLNAHCVNVSYRDGDYRRVLSQFDRLFADGIGMKIAAKATGIQLTENCNGTDLFPLVCVAASRHKTPIFFLGAQPGVAEEAARRAQIDHPRLPVAGTHHGFLQDASENDRAIEAINASGARILLVAMGVPHQELWIARNRHRLNVAVVIGVGGLFDFVSGRIARAPLALRNHGLEWAWRLAMEPRRMWQRYLVGNVEFLARAAWQATFVPAQFDQRLARKNEASTPEMSTAAAGPRYQNAA